jgi:hypothetical protein
MTPPAAPIMMCSKKIGVDPGPTAFVPGRPWVDVIGPTSANAARTS